MSAVPVRWRRRDVLAAALAGSAVPVAAWLAPAAARAAGQATPARPRADCALHRLHTGDLGALAAIDARLGGTPWRCLVDSGASVALVSPAVARRLALPVLRRGRVAAAGGTLVDVERVALPPVEVGDGDARLVLDAGEALVLDLAPLLGEVGAAVDGLIGAPALRPHVTRWALRDGRLQWLADVEPPAGAHADWPLQWDAGLPVVALALGDRDPAPFLLDSGNAGALVVFARHAASLGTGAQPLPQVTLQEVGGPVTVQQALLGRLNAPGYRARDVPIVFEAGGGARRGGHFDRLAGSAGLALFDAGVLTLDGPGGRLRVEQDGLPDVQPLAGGFGFALGAGRVVRAVFDGGPAARAGVRAGQRLRSLDDRALGDGAAAEVWRALAGRAQARFGFDGLAQPVTLARERFFARWD